MSEVKTIESVNPTQEELSAVITDISTLLGDSCTVSAQEFRFRKAKASDGSEYTRTPVILPVVVPSVSGLINILNEGGKQADLIMDAVESVVTTQIRNLLAEDEVGALHIGNFPVDKITWEYIANIPKATRGGGIPKDTWEAFIADYCAIMPAATGREPEKVARAAQLLQGKLAAVRSDKNVINFLISQLDIYVSNSPSAATYVECVDFLLKKAEMYLSSDEEALDSLL